jgi:hypothetical protein
MLQIPPKCWYLSARLHGVTSQNITILTYSHDSLKIHLTYFQIRKEGFSQIRSQWWSDRNEPDQESDPSSITWSPMFSVQILHHLVSENKTRSQMRVVCNDAVCHKVNKGRGIEDPGIPSPNIGRTQYRNALCVTHINNIFVFAARTFQPKMAGRYAGHDWTLILNTFLRWLMQQWFKGQRADERRVQISGFDLSHGDRLTCPRFPVVFLSPHKKIPGSYLKIGHDRIYFSVIIFLCGVLYGSVRS